MRALEWVGGLVLMLLAGLVVFMAFAYADAPTWMAFAAAVLAFCRTEKYV